MSEAELNLIKFRMRQGRLSKARRGALHTTLPPGYVLSGDEEVEKSPDMREQQVVELIFTKFRELGSAKQTHLWFVQEKIPVAVNVKRDVNGKKRRWKLPTYSFVLQFLRNPFYAGAYSYGRRGVRVRYEEGVIKKTGGHHKPRKEWEVLIRDHHAGYISWERYEDNLRIMAGNVNKAKTGERMGAIRKGKGLLAGLLRCGRCGRKMRVRYWGKKGTTPRYLCDGEFYHGGSYCQSFSAMKTDRVFEAELLALLEPAAVRASVEASATLVEESRDKLAALDRQLEQARYEAQRAELQYQQVDPLNRLVASELERRWNEKLEEAQALDNRLGEERESVRQPTKEEMQEVQALSERLPQVWRHPGIDPAIKKRIIRMLVKEVVPVLDEETNVITMMIHWQGGVHSKVEFKKPLRGESSTKTKEDVVELVRALSPHHSDEDIARILNCKKCKTGKGNAWNRIRVRSLRSKLRIAPFDRNKNREVLSLNEAARQLGVSPNTVRTLIGKGLIGATQVVKFAPFQIERSELEKKEVKEAMRILKKGGSLRSMGIVSKEQMSFVQ